MSLKRPRGPAGTLVVLELHSRILKGNPLGDPHVRKLGIWLPPQYDAAARSSPGQRFPVLYDLVGFTGSGLSHANWTSTANSARSRAASTAAASANPPAATATPTSTNGWTSA